jgi:hypothetical protein
VARNTKKYEKNKYDDNMKREVQIFQEARGASNETL